jgi:hypothetical protein
MQVLKAAGPQLVSAGMASWASHQIFMRPGQTWGPPRLSLSLVRHWRLFSHQAVPKSVQLSAVAPGGNKGPRSGPGPLSFGVPPAPPAAASTAPVPPVAVGAKARILFESG